MDGRDERLVLTGAAALYEKKGAESIARKEFDFACNEIKSRIVTRIEQPLTLLLLDFDFPFDIPMDTRHYPRALRHLQ